MMDPNFFTKKDEQGQTYAQFSFEPLPLSFGNSMGNALRRTLLSSLKGAAITQVKINGAPHLFSTVKGVKESVLELILNLQQLRFKTPSDGTFKVHLETTKGAKKLSGKDIKGEAEVVNQDLYLGQITDDKGKLEIDAIVETGVGNISKDEVEKGETGYITLDAYFSPVKKVNFKIEEARVGRKTNYDRLVMEVWTDGTMTPEKAVKQAAAILQSHFAHILSGKDVPHKAESAAESDKGAKEIDQKLKDIIIDELNLPSRVINALLRENIETIADLVKVGKEKLISVKGLGKKSFLLIEDELKKMGITID